MPPPAVSSRSSGWLHKLLLVLGVLALSPHFLLHIHSQDPVDPAVGLGVTPEVPTVKFKSEGGVYTLHVDDVQNALAAFPLLLVLFYTQWCPHCNPLHREFKSLVKLIDSRKLNVVVAKVDMGSLNGQYDTLEAMKIEGFPTIRLFKEGESLGTYIGSRSKEDIVAYIERKTKYQAVPIASVSELKKFLAKLPVPTADNSNTQKNANKAKANADKFDVEVGGVALAVFTSREFPSDSGLHGTAASKFFKVSSIYEAAAFCYSDHPLLIEHFGVPSDSLIVYPADELQVASVIPLTSDLSEVNITSIITKHLLPNTVTFNKHSQPSIRSFPIKKHALVFYDSSNKMHNTKFLPMIDKLAPHFRGSILFVKVPFEEYVVSQAFGVASSKAPKIIIADMSDPLNMRRYPFEDYQVPDWRCAGNSNTAPLEEGEDNGESTSPTCVADDGDGVEKVLREADVHSEEDLLRFFFDFQDGLLAPKFKSETEADIEHQNKQLLGNNLAVENIAGFQFKAAVLDNSINAFVYLYAPWCAHCKAMEPMIGDLAQSYAMDLDMKVFRMDSAKNEIEAPALKIRGYPAFYFFPADDKMNPIEYDGTRTVEAVRDFIEKHRTVPGASSVADATIIITEDLAIIEPDAVAANQDGQSAAVSDLGEQIEVDPTVTAGHELSEEEAYDSHSDGYSYEYDIQSSEDGSIPATD